MVEPPGRCVGEATICVANEEQIDPAITVEVGPGGSDGVGQRVRQKRSYISEALALLVSKESKASQGDNAQVGKTVAIKVGEIGSITGCFGQAHVFSPGRNGKYAMPIVLQQHVWSSACG